MAYDGRVFVTPANCVSEIRVRDAEITFHTPNDILRYLADNLERLEPDTLDWIDSFHKDCVFFDIGASHGPYSVYTAITASARVIAFEPEAQNYATLEMNHFLNRRRLAHSLMCFNLALGASSGVGRIYCQRYGAGWHMKILDRPVAVMDGANFEPEHIQTTVRETLDGVIARLSLPIPQYIKIDVDGSELGVIQGGAQTLSDPGVKSLLVEILDPEGHGELVVRLLDEAAFRLASKRQVENYSNLFNCVFERR